MNALDLLNAPAPVPAWLWALVCGLMFAALISAILAFRSIHRLRLALHRHHSPNCQCRDCIAIAGDTDRDPTPRQPDDLTTMQREQLAQIADHPTWDGDLMSKRARDELMHRGLIHRVAGFNVITMAGAAVRSTLRL